MDYREIAPSPRLARHVECLWTFGSGSRRVVHRVLPDGCTDLVFLISNGRVQASVAGAMTRPLITSMQPGEEVFGIRFHPAMSHGLLRAPVAMLTDAVTDLESLWGKDGRSLEQRLGDAGSMAARMALLEAMVDPPHSLTPVQRAAQFIQRNRESVSPDDLARNAGLSPRHFRRLCIEQAGIGAKTLCRVVRFRRAALDISRQSHEWADFALAHGYYDQAHFINEFKEFSGLTPAAYACSFSLPNRHDAARS